MKYTYEHIELKYLYRAVAWLGRNSMTILCLHLFEQNMIPWYKGLFRLGISNHTFVPIVVCKMIWAILGTIAVNKIKNWFLLQRT